MSMNLLKIWLMLSRYDTPAPPLFLDKFTNLASSFALPGNQANGVDWIFRSRQNIY